MVVAVTRAMLGPEITGRSFEDKLAADLDLTGNGLSTEAQQSGESDVFSDADGDTAYLNRIKFWKTPLANCGNGKTNCAPYSQWVAKWTSIKG